MNETEAQRFISDMEEINSRVTQFLKRLGENEVDAGDITELLALKGKCLVLKTQGNNICRNLAEGKSKEILRNRIAEIILTKFLIEGMIETVEKTLFFTHKK